MAKLFAFYIQHKSPVRFKLISMTDNGFKGSETFTKGDGKEIEKEIKDWVLNLTGKNCSVIGQINIPGYGQTYIAQEV